MNGIDDQALARRLEELRRGLWLFLRGLGVSASEADDLVHETYLRLYDGRAIPRNPDKLAPFLRTTARRLWLSRIREDERRQAILEADASEAVWHRLVPGDQPEDLMESLRECLSSLEGRSARVIQLYYREGQRIQEIAGELEISKSNVETILHRTRTAIRGCLERKVNE